MKLSCERYGNTGRMVHIAVGVCRLRANRATQHIEIYYTDDGSSPSTSSKLYQSGIAITNNVTIRAMIIIDAEERHYCEESFYLGQQPIQPMSVGHNPDDDQAIDGVRDQEAQGWWVNPQNDMRYEFRADGSLHQMTQVGLSDRVGQWWYDYPNDRDEDPEDHGVGEIVWSATRRAPLKMSSRDAQELLIGAEGSQWSLVRESKG